MQRYKDDCVLCRELNGSKDTNFHTIYGEEYSRILAETENFVLIPALGQLTKNQSLILPKAHYLSMKEAINDFSEIEKLLLYYQNNFLEKGNEIMVFENGNSSVTKSSCIEHAHLNILPIKFDFGDNVSRFFDDDCNVVFNNDLEKLYCDISFDKTYRIVGVLSSGFYFMYLNKKPESQYMRKIISELLQYNKWDWKEFGLQESLLKTLELNKGYNDE